MTSLIGSVVAGALIVYGITALAIAWFAPVRVDAAKSLAALAPPTSVTRRPAATGTPSDAIERVGLWGQRVLPDTAWYRTPYRELALLRIPVARFYGDKLVQAACGLLLAPLASWVLGMVGLRLPAVVTAAGAVALAVVLFFGPNYSITAMANEARAVFRSELTSWVDAVAIERASGSGVRQAMEHAAALGDHWVWIRLDEELRRSRWSGIPPWDALKSLADELALPELNDVADILGNAGEEGTAAWGSLRARTTSLRAAILSDDVTRANADNERMSIPAALLGVVFVALIVMPAVLRIVLHT
ncbi:hypothetical protein ACFS27_22760 [Promicromonospora vindobonensis]|uniref:Flp pilus assembly protein TadB n=1 Tax=Promicromonospora vindobonensis TaxID=195748 RepID=A0ABW5W0M6_9MICO